MPELVPRAQLPAALALNGVAMNASRIVGPLGPVPVIGVTSASAAPGSKYGRARWHLLRLSRDDRGWKIDLELRALRADGKGCEPDGILSFHAPVAPAVVP